MKAHDPAPDEDASAYTFHVRVRVPLSRRHVRALVAIALASLAHVAMLVVIDHLPEPKKAPRKPVELAIVQQPRSQPRSEPSVPTETARVAPKTARPSRLPPPPPTAPVLPELPPSPRDDVPVLPNAERAPEATPMPPQSWAQSLQDSLRATRPKPSTAIPAELMPSIATLDRVAAADPRMHDDELERRMAHDYGQFFRRGLEALRSNWHPVVVLNRTERSRDPERRCGRRDRTTFAVAVIDKQGNVVDVDLKNPSGCDDLDEEAVAAFKRVGQFPHPPEEIFVAPDGTPMETARYPVRFIVMFNGGIQLDWRG